MADVFLSYKREDQTIARDIAADLEAEGFSVFFDVRIPVGDSWDAMIERELETAKAVVVLWSPASRESQWVRREAREAMARGLLCPATISPCKPPLEFSDVQAADLTRWRGGSRTHAEWRRLCDDGIARCIGRLDNNVPILAPSPVAPVPNPIGQGTNLKSESSARTSKLPFWAIAAVLLTVGMGITLAVSLVEAPEREIVSAKGDVSAATSTSPQIREAETEGDSEIIEFSSSDDELVSADPSRTEWSSTIRDLQISLRWLGYYSSTIDGVVGPNTQKAANEYASSAGLRAPNLEAASDEEILQFYEPIKIAASSAETAWNRNVDIEEAIKLGAEAFDKQDFKQAYLSFGKACDLGSLDACVRVGTLLYEGKGTEPNYAEAVRQFEAACIAKHPVACLWLGDAKLTGKGAEKNVADANQFFQKACSLGLQEACKEYLVIQTDQPQRKIYIDPSRRTVGEVKYE